MPIGTGFQWAKTISVIQASVLLQNQQARSAAGLRQSRCSLCLLQLGSGINFRATIRISNIPCAAAEITNKGTEIWWPTDVKDDETGDYCRHGPCIKIASYIEAGKTASETCKVSDPFTGLPVDVTCHRRVDVEIKLKSTSFSRLQGILRHPSGLLHSIFPQVPGMGGR